MSLGPAFVAVHGILFLLFAAVLLGALRTLRRMEFFAPVYGARRVTFDFRSGQAFPCELLPPDLRVKAETGTLLLLFASPWCAWCEDVVPGLRGLAFDYPNAGFAVLSDDPWPALASGRRRALPVLVNSPIAKRLGVTQQPFGMKVQNGRIIDFGIVNSLEHVESLL